MKRKMKNSVLATFTTLALGAVALGVTAPRMLNAHAALDADTFKIADVSVRLMEKTAGSDDQSAIRFTVQMATAEYEALIDEGTGAFLDGVTVGALLLPADLTSETELTLDTDPTGEATVFVEELTADEWYVNVDDESVMEAFVYLYNFPASDYNRTILANAFVDGDGDPVYAGTVAQSMASVALAAVESDPLAENYLLDYAVTFIADGEPVAVEDVQYGSKVSTPAEPTAPSGKAFAGWFADENCTQAFDFDAAITGTTTAYAKFIETYAVTGQLKGWKNETLTGAKVSVTDGAGKAHTLSIDDDGTITGALPAGEYTVSVGATGYLTTSKALQVTDGENKLDTQLHYGFSHVIKDAGTRVDIPFYTITENYKTHEGGVESFYVNTQNGTVQLPGFRANRIYFDSFAESRYVFGADVTYRYLDNGNFVNLAQGANHGQNGLVVAGAGYEMAFLLKGNDIRIMNGDLNFGGQYMHVAAGVPNTFSLTDARGSRFMMIARDNSGLSVYVDGVKYLTVAVDGTIAAVNGGAHTYSKGDEAWFKTAFAAVLADGQKNELGFTGLPNEGQGCNNTMFRDYFRTTDTSVLAEYTMFGTATVNGKSVQKRVVASYNDASLVKIDSGNWYYDKSTGKLYNCAGKSGYDNNLVFINNVQSGDFHFTTVMKNNSAYTQFGIALTDGTNNVIFNVLGASGMRVTVNGTITDTPTWGFYNSDGVNLGTKTSVDTPNVEKKVELIKENGSLKFYMTDIVDGVEGTRYHVWTLTTSGFTTEHYMDAEKTKQSVAIGATLKNALTSILSGEVACGFGNIIGGNAADYPKTVYSQISVLPLA